MGLVLDATIQHKVRQTERQAAEVLRSLLLPYTQPETAQHKAPKLLLPLLHEA